VIEGDINTAHAFLKKLREGTSGHTRLMGLWHLMNGDGIEIEEAFAVHNPGLLSIFAQKHTNLTSNVVSNPETFLSQSWKEAKDKHGTRKWTREEYEKKVAQFRWNESLHVPIIPTIHGTNEDIAYNIIKTGFVALAKLDSGYYGKGIYFTTSAEYGLPYYATKVSPTIIISLVISGNSYPVIEHPRLSKRSFMGAALMPGYNSHYILTRKDGFPCRKVYSGLGEEEFYDEVVIEQESFVLPFYLLKISNKNLGILAMALQKEQERLRIEEQARKEKNLHSNSKGGDVGIGLPVKTRTGEIIEKQKVSSSSSGEGDKAIRLKKIEPVDSDSSSEERKNLVDKRLSPSE